MPTQDPRRYPAAAASPAPMPGLYGIAEASLAAATGSIASEADAQLDAALDAMLRGDGAALARLFRGAPSAAVYRHLWRRLAARERRVDDDAALRVTHFAIPLVIVAALEGGESPASTLSGVVPDIAELCGLLREHQALAGNENFALGNTLVSAEALDFAHLPQLLARRVAAAVSTEMSTGAAPPIELPPAPMVIASTTEAVHLRFLVGTALAAPMADVLRDEAVGRWGIPFAAALARGIGAPGVSVLALPRAPQGLVPALLHGRVAQREVSAQLFASNAIRNFRAGVGEPQAMISVHGPLEEGGGEVRLSLSSPFEPRDAEGFRCPLLPQDRVEDVVRMLTDLLRDCRVASVREVPGLHPDRDAVTGLPLLFKEHTVPEALPRVH